MVIKRILTDWNLHDVILSLNEFYIQSYFSIKKRDKHTDTQTRPPLRNKYLWTHYYHKVGINHIQNQMECTSKQKQTANNFDGIEYLKNEKYTETLPECTFVIDTPALLIDIVY